MQHHRPRRGSLYTRRIDIWQPIKPLVITMGCLLLLSALVIYGIPGYFSTLYYALFEFEWVKTYEVLQGLRHTETGGGIMDPIWFFVVCLLGIAAFQVPVGIILVTIMWITIAGMMAYMLFFLR